MIKISIVALIAFLTLGSSAFQLQGPIRATTNSVFAPQQRLGRLNMFSNKNDREEVNGIDKARSAAAGAVLATYLLTNAMIAAPAFATYDYDKASTDIGSSIILAGRTGARAGGRSSTTSLSASSRSYEPVRSTTTIIQPTIGLAPAAPVVVSPFGYSYGYNPMPGLGLGLGLSAVNSVGNEIRDYNQEREIAQSKIELEQAKGREALLEQRLKALEDAQRK
jgi:hypothetical protein